MRILLILASNDVRVSIRVRNAVRRRLSPLVTSVVGALLLTAAVSCQSTPEGPASAEQRPNVLFIAIDDLRPELGAYGHEEIHSPHIDRLAETGRLFERAYVQQAVCSPSRTSLMTGLRPDSTRIYDLSTHFRSTIPDVITLPQAFKRAGYHAEWWGKIYHAALLDSASWSRQGRRLEPQDNWRAYVLEESKEVAAAHDGAGPAFERGVLPDSAYPDGQVARRALSALDRLSGRDQPFFLAVGFYKPHLPFNCPDRYWEKYDRSEIALPDRSSPPAGAPRWATTEWWELRSYAGIPTSGDLDPELARTLVHGYRACVSYADAQVGKLLDGLEKHDITEETIVVLWGDHGWKLGEYGDWTKHTNFEIDTRAPLIIRTPDVRKPGTAAPAIVEMVDLYPTLCELADIDCPTRLQGSSIAELVRDPASEEPGDTAEYALSQYPRGEEVMGYSMRTDRYRYTRWERRDADTVLARELYDHQNGTVAETNLAADPTHDTLVARLDSLLSVRWRRSLTD